MNKFRADGGTELIEALRKILEAEKISKFRKREILVITGKCLPFSGFIFVTIDLPF